MFKRKKKSEFVLTDLWFKNQLHDQFIAKRILRYNKFAQIVEIQYWKHSKANEENNCQ